MNVVILILAAGASSRMGGEDKLMLPIDGEPLLKRVVSRAVLTGAPVRVVLSDRTGPRAKVVSEIDGAIVVLAKDAAQGMSASIRAGVGAAKRADAVLVVPGDMPDLTTEDLCTVIELAGRAPNSAIIRATSEDGRPGHPVLFPNPYFSALSSLTGDNGARSILQNHGCKLIHVALPFENAITDLDTPNDWKEWRSWPP